MGKAKGNMTGNRNVQQKQFDSVVKELKLTENQAKQLHKTIHGQSYGYQEILQEAKYLFNK
jgi:Spy/CpxP family protein refolding chaperone